MVLKMSGAVRRAACRWGSGVMLFRFDEGKLVWDKFFASRADALETLGQQE